MIFRHPGLEARRGQGVWTALRSAPPDKEAVGQAAEHAQDSYSMIPLPPAAVVVVTDVQTLVQAAFAAPGLPVERPPEQGRPQADRSPGDKSRLFLFASLSLAQQSRGLAIDNLSFSASVWPAGMSCPPLVALASGTNLLICCPTIAGLSYQVQYTTNLTGAPWLPLGAVLPGTGGPLTFTNGLTPSAEGFYRLMILP